MQLYYYPNRPILIPPDKARINAYESSGQYIGELKWNGDNTLLDTNKPLEFWNRHKERHRFIPNEIMREELSKWPKDMVINAELMHYRTWEIKNVLIVHCVMVWKGKPLIGKTWGDSRKILDDMPSATCVKVSEIFQTGFWDKFQATDGVTIEGIILKNPTGKLVFSTTPIPDTSFMFKIRKPNKKYPF
jgi:hypothetical protein